MERLSGTHVFVLGARHLRIYFLMTTIKMELNSFGLVVFSYSSLRHLPRDFPKEQLIVGSRVKEPGLGRRGS